MAKPKVTKYLIVDDDTNLLKALEACLADESCECRTFSDVNSTIDALKTWHPDILLLDVCLPDGSAFDVLEIFRHQRPVPLIIAMSGMAGPQDTFRLAHLGVRAFLQKPFNLGDLEATIKNARKTPPNLRPQLRGLVGKRSIHDVESEVRSIMVEEALARSQGSKRGAAKLLDVSRQLIQHMVKRIEDFGPAYQ